MQHFCMGGTGIALASTGGGFSLPHHGSLRVAEAAIIEDYGALTDSNERRAIEAE